MAGSVGFHQKIEPFCSTSVYCRVTGAVNRNLIFLAFLVKNEPFFDTDCDRRSRLYCNIMRRRIMCRPFEPLASSLKRFKRKGENHT